MKAKLVPTPLHSTKARAHVRVVPVPPPQRFRRLAAIWQMMRLGLALTALRLRRGDHAEERAALVASFLEQMGGLWIKVGQVVALRRDLLSNDMANALSRLQDSTFGFPFSAIQADIEAAVRRPLRQVFAELDPEPLAAASIGQVHAGRLLGGRRVVVKVQKPLAREMFEKDLGLISLMVRFLSTIPGIGHLGWDEFMKEVNQIVLEELDYRQEAASIRRMRKALRPQKVVVPRVYLTLCSERVLVMERIDGLFMTEYIHAAHAEPALLAEWCRKNRVRPKKVARRLLISQLRQIFEENLFHGDLHPGNIVLLRKSRVALIDFGSVGMLDAEFLSRYGLYMRALAGHHFEKAAEYMLSFAKQLPAGQVRQLRDEVAFAMRVWAIRSSVSTLPYHDRSLAAATDDINKVTARYKMSVSWALLKIGRSWATLDASLSHLDPEFDHLGVISDYASNSRARLLKQLPAALAEIPQAMSELANSLGPQLRLSMLDLKAQASKASRIAGGVMRTAMWALVIGLPILGWVFLEQHKASSSAHQEIEHLLVQLAGDEAALLGDQVPYVPLLFWCFIGLALLVLIVLARRAAWILFEPDSRD